MQQAITGFRQDEERHWVAELACGHAQHVRHDPPWQVREWVLNEATRAARLGSLLDCRRCDDAITMAIPDGLAGIEVERYRDARLRGLCHEGALEAALAASSNGG